MATSEMSVPTITNDNANDNNYDDDHNHNTGAGADGLFEWIVNVPTVAQTPRSHLTRV